MVDTSSQEWRMVCLARHVCRLPNKNERQALLDRLASKHSPDFVAQLQTLVMQQWSIVRLAIEICQLPNKPARHVRLAELRTEHPQEFVMEVEKQVLVEWALIHPNFKGKAANGNA